MIKQLLKKKDGFTLVELLAVIVILAIIAAIAVPSVAHIIDNTKKDASVAEAIQIVDSAKLYVASNNISSDKDLNATQLKSYLTNVKSTTKYTVHVAFASDGTPSYTIDDSALDGITGMSATGVTEKTLLNYKK